MADFLGHNLTQVHLRHDYTILYSTLEDTGGRVHCLVRQGIMTGKGVGGGGLRTQAAGHVGTNSVPEGNTFLVLIFLSRASSATCS